MLSRSEDGGNRRGFAEAVDLIQSRYGWTDQEVLDLPYARFREILEVVVDAVGQEKRDRMVEAAFIGWQGYLGWPKAKGRQPMQFRRWLSQMGLEDKPEPPSEAERTRTILKARDVERKVVEVFG